MGLGVEVGILVDLLAADPEGSAQVRKELGAISDSLVAEGLPPHREPEAGIEPASYDLGPYTALHALRRIGAHLSEGQHLPPPATQDDAEDPVLERRYRRGGRFARGEGPQPFAHLIDHADDGGYYVPVDFPDPLLAGGELVGSSHQLLAECDALAAALGVPDDLDPEDDARFEASAVRPGGDELWERYGLESFVCVRLRAAARHSIRTGAAVAFT